MSIVWECSRAKASELLVLLAIADCANDDGTDAYPSLPKLAQKSRMTARGVQYVIERLEALGEIRVRRERGRNHVNHYDVLVENLQSLRVSENMQTDAENMNTATGKHERAIASDPSVHPSLDPSVPVPVGARASGLSPDGLMALWNAHKSARQPRCETMNSTRRASARARIAEVRRYLCRTDGREPSVVDEQNWWARLVDALAAKPWHNGENDRGWIADFDFLVRTTTWGRYVEHRLGGSNITPRAETAEGQRQQTRNANVSHVARQRLYQPGTDDHADE